MGKLKASALLDWANPVISAVNKIKYVFTGFSP